jgi:hypothetical protein
MIVKRTLVLECFGVEGGVLRGVVAAVCWREKGSCLEARNSDQATL